MKAVGSQRSDKHLEDSCSLFEVILGDEVVRQLLEQLQHVLVILDHRPVYNHKRVYNLFCSSPLLVKVKHLRQLAAFVHGIVHRIGRRPLLLLLWHRHLSRLFRHHLHLSRRRTSHKEPAKKVKAFGQTTSSVVIDFGQFMRRAIKP